MMNHYSEVKIVNLEPMRVASYTARSMEPENDSIEYMKNWLKNQGLDSETGVREFGFDVCVSEEQRQQGMRGYEFWVSVPEHVEATDGVVIKQFPGGRYALMQIRDPFSDPFQLIPGGWQTLSHWVNNQGYQPLCWPTGDQPGLEEVLEDEKGTYMNIYLPIQ